MATAPVSFLPFIVQSSQSWQCAEVCLIWHAMNEVDQAVNLIAPKAAPYFAPN
jgi:hypothetical protein